MEDLVKPAIQSVLVDGEIKLHLNVLKIRTLVKQYSRLEYFSSIVVGTANSCISTATVKKILWLLNLSKKREFGLNQ
jgi:hypothetical protein